MAPVVGRDPSPARERPPLSLTSFHYTNPLLVAVLSSTVLLSARFGYLRLFRRFASVDDVALHRPRWIRGVVTSVGDADNFRLWHTPLARRTIIPSTRAGLKDQTLHIRLAGVDAPEMAHFGNPAQPYSTEASNWLTETVLGKSVRVHLFSKDRFGRMVGMVYVRKFPYLFRKNVSEEMLKVGLATVYTQKGAVHAGLLSRFEKIEKTARSKRVGMWEQQGTAYESPAEYKKRVTTPK